MTTAGTAATVNNGGNGTYYQGVSRDPVDNVSTGSIVKGAAPQSVVKQWRLLYGPVPLRLSATH